MFDVLTPYRLPPGFVSDYVVASLPPFALFLIFPGHKMSFPPGDIGHGTGTPYPRSGKEAAMGMDLCGKGDRYIRFGFEGWARALMVAVAHGWKPMGTNPPRGEPKSKPHSWGYAGNEGQLVWARDARNLADALDLAIEGPPLSREVLIDNLRKWLKSAKGRESIGVLISMAEFNDEFARSINRRSAGKGKGKRRRRPAPDLLPPLNDDEREYFAEFVEFLRGGSFRIC